MSPQRRIDLSHSTNSLSRPLGSKDKISSPRPASHVLYRSSLGKKVKCKTGRRRPMSPRAQPELFSLDKRASKNRKRRVSEEECTTIRPVNYHIRCLAREGSAASQCRRIEPTDIEGCSKVGLQPSLVRNRRTSRLFGFVPKDSMRERKREDGGDKIGDQTTMAEDSTKRKTHRRRGTYQPRIMHRPFALRGLQNTALGPTTSSNGVEVDVHRVSTWSVLRVTSGVVQNAHCATLRTRRDAEGRDYGMCSRLPDELA